MNILGISAFYHDSAACLLMDGKLVAAAQEERFTRVKHDAAFPVHAMDVCLRQGGISIANVDIVAYYEKPFLKFDRLLETYSAFAPRGLTSFLAAMPLWLKSKLLLKKNMERAMDGFAGKFIFCEHHESHAASAFYPSPFQEAAILAADGVGEWTSTSWGAGVGNSFSLSHELRFPHSLGLLYSAFTYYTGFKVNSGEYKVMGLAPYGEPRYLDLILRELLDLREDGSFRLNMDYFDYCTGLKMTNEKFDALFGGPPRKPETQLTQREMDIARSVQDAAEMVMSRMAKHIAKETKMPNLCMAGGVALNCVANGKILREGIFRNIWVQPAAGDAGGALGAAFLAWHKVAGMPRQAEGTRDMMRGAFLGPAFSDDEIKEFIHKRCIPHMKFGRNEVIAETARHLAGGKVVGWFRGHMEFGPRALGCRSILGNPMLGDMRSKMNLKIKFRESFRPFAPAVLAEKAHEYFDINIPSPYMLFVAPVAASRRNPISPGQEKLFGIEKLNIPRSSIPAVTHVDYSARVQTVERAINPDFYDLISEFEKLTRCPVLINTSFNVRGEPLVNSPSDAYTCFMRTSIDYLVMGNYILDKAEQPAFEEGEVWRQTFALD